MKQRRPLGKKNRTFAWISCCALSLALPAGAWADTTPQKPAKQAQKPTDKAEEAKKRDAKQKFTEGREALNRGEYTTALVLFRTSQELYPSPGTLLNLALCEERLGMLGTAYLHFQEVQKLLPSDDERASIANTGALALQPRVPKLRIELAKGAPSDTVVTLSGRVLSTEELAADQYLDPGKAVVVVSAAGRPEKVYEATLVEGKRSTLTVEPGALPPPEPPTPPPLASSGIQAPAGNGAMAQGPQVGARPDIIILPPDPRLRMAAYIAGGIGLLGLGVGGVGGIAALIKKNEVDSICTDPVYCSGEGLEAERTGKSFAAMSTIGFSVGLVGAAAGVTLWLLSGGGPAEAKKTGGVVKNTSITLGMGRLGVQGQF